MLSWLRQRSHPQMPLAQPNLDSRNHHLFFFELFGRLRQTFSIAIYTKLKLSCTFIRLKICFYTTVTHKWIGFLVLEKSRDQRKEDNQTLKDAGKYTAMTKQEQIRFQFKSNKTISYFRVKQLGWRGRGEIMTVFANVNLVISRWICIHQQRNQQRMKVFTFFFQWKTRSALWKSATEMSANAAEERMENNSVTITFYCRKIAGTLVNQEHRVDMKTAVRLRGYVIIISWISIILLSLLGVATFGKHVERNNSLFQTNSSNFSVNFLTFVLSQTKTLFINDTQFCRANACLISAQINSVRLLEQTTENKMMKSETLL